MTQNDQATFSHYFVRHGVQGDISRFRTVDGTLYRRGQQAICQTAQGLIVGEVLSKISADQMTPNLLLRPMSPQDHLLKQRLERYKIEAIEKCRERMSSLNVTTQLLDVDYLFDGRTLMFYFLGDVSPELSALTDELASEYEREARAGKFAELLDSGCGPGCGTAEKSGCGTAGGCAVCVAASACRK